MLKKSDYCCYPFIHNKEWATDFEVFTDGLSSEIGFAYAQQSFYRYKLKQDLVNICEIVLDLNPMIRKFDKKILKDSLVRIENIYKKYKVNYGYFYLPIGTKSATSLSRLRFSCKKIIRLLVKYECKNEELLKCFNMLTNLFHLMWFKTTNKKIKFISKTYV